MRKEREDFSPMQVEETPAENYKLTEVMDKKKILSKHPCLFLPELWVKIMSNHSPRLAQVGVWLYVLQGLRNLTPRN